eukprot:689000-Rhodomonas_salina.2
MPTQTLPAEDAYAGRKAAQERSKGSSIFQTTTENEFRPSRKVNIRNSIQKAPRFGFLSPRTPATSCEVLTWCIVLPVRQSTLRCRTSRTKSGETEIPSLRVGSKLKSFPLCLHRPPSQKTRRGVRVGPWEHSTGGARIRVKG